jgi:hypothetical protein
VLKFDEVIAAIKGIAINVSGGAPVEPADAVQATLVDWAEETRAYFTGGLKVVSDALLLPLNQIRERLESLELGTLRMLVFPELQKMSGILAGIYFQLNALGAGTPGGEYIPNMTFAGAGNGGLTINGLNITGVGRREILENFSRALEEWGIAY